MARVRKQIIPNTYLKQVGSVATSYSAITTIITPRLFSTNFGKEAPHDTFNSRISCHF